MDTTDYVSLVIDRVDIQYRGLRSMYSWYLFGDKRPGSVTERFLADAASFDEYRRLFQP